MSSRAGRLIDSPPVWSPIAGAVASVLAVALVTAVIFLVRDVVPVLSLGVLYVFAVLPVAVVWGLPFSLPVAVGSMLAFNFFFLPPVHTFTLSESENWFSLAVYSGTAIVVSELAARSRRRTAEAEQRRREAALLADISTDLLQGRAVREELARIEERSAEVLGTAGMRIDLEQPSRSAPTAASYPLETAGRVVGRISIPSGEEPALGTRERFLPALAALLAVAVDRERLAAQALEAEALGRSDALKTALLRAVSHDLRSPLTAISTAVSGLRNDELKLDSADRRQLLETIAIESDRLERLVSNLLDLSRIQMGAAPPAQELWTIDQLVAQALAQVVEADRVEVSLPEDVPVVRVDAIQIERVLVNLIENALKFSPAGSSVSVRVNANRLEAVLRVVDTGPGLPQDELERIFEPFHRAAGERVPRCRPRSRDCARVRRGQRRAGLGGVGCRSGRLVRARPPGRRDAGRGLCVNGARVLVVDDEPQILRALQTTLRGAGYEVVTATTAEEALASAAIRSPDAVILDLVLPDGSGVEVCRELRTWTTVPVLILSAVGEEREKVAALDAGADDYVTKPFGVDELLARLRAAMRRAGPPGDPVITIGELSVDLEKRAVSVAGRAVQLTPHEYAILRFLAQNEGKLLTHQAILREVWGPAYQVESHYLHVYVSQLRRKIEPVPTRPRYILTEPGAGYRLVAPPISS